MRVHITSHVRRPGIAARPLRRAILYTLRRQRCPAGTQVGIALVSDAALRRLNRTFLGVDRPTDVLSFPTLAVRRRPRRRSISAPGSRLPVPDPKRYLGDVAISVDRARVQARDARHALRTEIVLLAVHGILHLLGYDDHRPADAARMRLRQRALTSGAGFEVAG